MWRAGPTRIRHGTQGHVAAPRRPTRGGGADTWQGHGSPRGRPGGGTTWQVRGMAVDGPMG